jgi:hypothetical protein
MQKYCIFMLFPLTIPFGVYPKPFYFSLFFGNAFFRYSNKISYGINHDFFSDIILFFPFPFRKGFSQVHPIPFLTMHFS